MFLIYDIIFLFYALVYLPYLLLTDRVYKDFGMRFGSFPSPLKDQIRAKANIWLHAVSVGEVMVIDGFIDRLMATYPKNQMIVTVTTKTGYLLASQRLRSRALVIPSPIDFSIVAGLFVSLICPKMYIACETEIWPNLFKKLYDQRIPIAVINGRISDSSFGRYKSIRFLLNKILNQVQVWCMQSPLDAERIKDLGAEPSRVVITGNMKFDDTSLLSQAPVLPIKSTEDVLWWVAGSTHPGEEEIVLDVFSKIVSKDPQWRLIIAPRHIDRVPEVIEIIARRGFNAVKLSLISAKNVDQGNNKTIIIVDTIGQLRSLYELASLVFVGKSLCIGGGHNIIEPANYAKAIIIGPKFGNFKDIVTCFKEGNAIVQVEDLRSFEIAVKDLCSDSVKREFLGAAAKKVIVANQGASKRSIECLAEFLK